MHEILRKVEYPFYLQGSIKDKSNPRDYITDCKFHIHKRIIISEDITNFFDSIKSDLVFKMWKYFFNFPEDVALVLTQLTTYKGFDPQGASTSSYIANLIFWDIEPFVVKQLNEMGICYSRYVDDITLSSERFITTEDQTFATSLIYGMLFKRGVRPNRKKRKVYSSSNRMIVHNLNTNSKKPTLSNEERNNIRAIVKKCEIMAQSDRYSQDYIKYYNSAFGKVGKLSRLHKIEGIKLRDRLQEIKPF